MRRSLLYTLLVTSFIHSQCLANIFDLFKKNYESPDCNVSLQLENISSTNSSVPSINEEDIKKIIQNRLVKRTFTLAGYVAPANEVEDQKKENLNEENIEKPENAETISENASTDLAQDNADPVSTDAETTSYALKLTIQQGSKEVGKRKIAVCKVEKLKIWAIATRMPLKNETTVREEHTVNEKKPEEAMEEACRLAFARALRGSGRCTSSSDAKDLPATL